MSKTSHEQPVQLRIGFSAPTRPLTVALALSGISVLVEAVNGTYDEVYHYLTSAGVVPTSDDVRGISFPVMMLPLLQNLPDQVNVAPEPVLRPLYLLAVHPSAENLPATLDQDLVGDLRLSWFDGEVNWEESFDPAAAPALLSSELAFVATPEAWAVLKASSRLPVLAGRARINLDGYVEIYTTKPQLAEGAPLPGMFRLDETHFGLPLPYASSIDQNPGFVWEGHRPRIERGPHRLPELPIELSSHAREDLVKLVDSLAAYRAQAVIWDAGLGRRIFTLAAVEALDAYPLLVVTPPSGVWVWQRHLDLMNRSHSLTHDRAEARIVTYHDIAQGVPLPSPQAVIFDDLASEEATSPEAQAALHRLDGILDAYRIACDSSWPSSLEEGVAIMSVLRPGEFRSDVPLVQRYPVHTERRAREHVKAYLFRRSMEETTTHGYEHFRRSSVMVVEPSEAQVRAFSDAATRQGAHNPSSLLAELLETVSAGPTHAISPKVAAAARRVKEAVEGNRSIAVVTRHRRSALLLKSALRPMPVLSVDASEGIPPEDAQVVVVRFDSTIPSLRRFDEVVCLDYPWSSETLERAVGSAADDQGPSQVTCIHMAGTVDDRLAMLAARRREVAAVELPEVPPNFSEISYLLSPRWQKS